MSLFSKLLVVLILLAASLLFQGCFLAIDIAILVQLGVVEDQNVIDIQLCYFTGHSVVFIGMIITIYLSCMNVPQQQKHNFICRLTPCLFSFTLTQLCFIAVSKAALGAPLCLVSNMFWSQQLCVLDLLVTCTSRFSNSHFGFISYMFWSYLQHLLNLRIARTCLSS